MKIARLTDYAFMVLAALDGQAQLSAAVLAQKTELGEPTVSKILKCLSRAGLVQSARGAMGGYRLAKPAKDIDLAAVIEAMEGPIALTRCTQDSAPECLSASCCGVQGKWGDVNGIVRSALANVSLADMGAKLA
jgi:FeS assembly SUF system regulator